MGLNLLFDGLHPLAQVLLPQVQRQLDSVARRRSLEMHQYQQQQQQHMQEQQEWLEERHALQAKLEEAVTDLARARCEESDAKDKMQTLVGELKIKQAAAASAANKADMTITQLQGMLALCRKARTAQSPIKAARAQQPRVLALQEQVSVLERTLQQATASLGLHASLPRDDPSHARPSNTICSEGRHEQGSGVGSARRGDIARGAKRELPVFERLLNAAANLSVGQVQLLSLGDGAHAETAVEWADAESNVAAQMRHLLHCIVAASNEASALDDALAASRAHETELAGQLGKMQLRAAHAAVDACQSHVSTPVPCGTDLKREREHETDEEMAIKVLAARATAQNEKTKRKALERKMRACSRELDSRKRLTPQRAPPREEGSQVLSSEGSLGVQHSPSSQHMRQVPDAKYEHARYRSGWKPNVTQVLEAQCSAAGRRSNPKLSWHIEVSNRQA